MMKGRVAAVGALVAMGLASPAFAQTNATAHQAIQAGDYQAAEARLTSELRVHPGRPELLLNLATVYARTGRTEQARALFQTVLQRDEVLLDVSSDQVAGSHAIALRALNQLAPLTLTSR